MNFQNWMFIGVIISVVLLAGCSQASSPMNPSGESNSALSHELLPVGVAEVYPDGSPAGGMGTLGLFELHIDKSVINAELTSLRSSALTDVLEVVDITNFLRLAPCTDCVRINSVSLNADGNPVVSIGIKHPFGAGDVMKPISGKNRADLHVFNVEGIVLSNAAGKSFAGLGETVAGFRLLSADGYTGYLDSVIDSMYPTDATVHPYVLHFDDYSAGNFDSANPMGFLSVTDPPPSGNLVMAMGCDYDYQDYVFDFPDVTEIDMIFAVGCTYAVSAASKNLRFTPEYRVPQHNKKAASEVSVAIISNDLKGEDSESSAEIQIRIVDISHSVTVGLGLDEMFADSSVSEISVDVPGLTNNPVLISGSTPLSGTGHDPSDPLIYQATIVNEASAAEGSYTGLVKVLDSYSTGLNQSALLNSMDGIERVSPIENPLAGLFEISEFATYQIFSIDVATGIYLNVLEPNGGEEWEGLSHQDISWESSNNIEFVDIFYSKDDFVSDINEIVTNYANTGIYDWLVENDPSVTVKIRVADSAGAIQDESDDYFTILESGCNFGTTGFQLAQSYSITNRWTYMGVKVTHQDPIQRLIFQGYPATDTLFIHNADNPNVAVESYNTGDLIYCNNNRAFWVDPVSEPGIDRIIYNNYGGGSPTDGYQLKTIDWDGTQFTNPQILPKHGSIWNLCVTPEGDLISHNARTYDPTFYRRDKSSNYALSTLFTITSATCDFGTVSNIKDIAYDSLLDAVILFCRNTNVSNGGQLYVLDMSGNLLFQDRDIFGDSLISYNASVDIDINNPRCRVVVYAGQNEHNGQYWIGRYSWDFIEKSVQGYTGLTYGPARGELSEDGTLWAAWENSRGVIKFNPPPDW